MNKLTLLSLIIFIALVACQPAVDLSQPPEILFGEDICDECNMIISEPRFAAAYFTFDGTARRFDDIGGMFIFHAEHDEDVAQFWVHDYKLEKWLAAVNAFFVVSDNLQTPMGHGVVAFEFEDQAQSFAAEVDGMVMAFSMLRDSYQNGDSSPEHTEP